MIYLEKNATVRKTNPGYLAEWQYLDKSGKPSTASTKFQDEALKNFVSSPENVCGNVVLLRAYEENRWVIKDILPAEMPYETSLYISTTTASSDSLIKLTNGISIWDLEINGNQKSMLQWAKNRGIAIYIQLTTKGDQFSTIIDCPELPNEISGTFRGKSDARYSFKGTITTEILGVASEVPSSIKDRKLFYSIGLHHSNLDCNVEFTVKAKWDGNNCNYVVTKIEQLLELGKVDFILAGIAQENDLTILLLESQKLEHKGLVFSCLYSSKCPTIRKYDRSTSNPILVTAEIVGDLDKQKIYLRAFKQQSAEPINAYISRIATNKEKGESNHSRYEISIADMGDGFFSLEDNIDFFPYFQFEEQCRPILVPVEFKEGFPGLRLALKDGFKVTGQFECGGWLGDKEDSYRFFVQSKNDGIACLVSFKEMLRAGLIDLAIGSRLDLTLLVQETAPTSKKSKKIQREFRIEAMSGDVFTKAEAGNFEGRISPITEWSPYILRDVELPGFYNSAALVGIKLDCGITCMLPISASMLSKSGHFRWDIKDSLAANFRITKQTVAPFFNLSCLGIERRAVSENDLSTVLVKLKASPTNENPHYEFEIINGRETALSAGKIVKYKRGSRKLHINLDDLRVKTAELEVIVACWREEFHLQKIVKITFIPNDD